jgi:hypothetical protein
LDLYRLNKKFEPVLAADDDYEAFDKRWHIQHKRKYFGKYEVCVSTVFLALDHRYYGDSGPPIVFETMIFGGKHDQYQERYETYPEALEGHRKALKLARIKAIVEDERPEPDIELKTSKRSIKL